MPSSPPVHTLRARLVFPVEGEPIAGGCVTLAGDRIVAVGNRPDGPVEDLGDAALLPGLVNAHVHLELSGLASPIGQPGTPLLDWLRLLVSRFRHGVAPEEAEAAVAGGLAESLGGGVTRLGEIAQPGWSPAPFTESPVRATVFLELIAPTRPRVASGVELAQRHLDAVAPSMESSASAAWQPGLSPHAPYSVHPDLFQAAVDLARHGGVPLAMHLAESREELELLRTGKGPFRELLEERGQWDPAAHRPGRRPLDYLRRLAAAPRALVIHGNYLDPEEIALLAERAERMTVVYCPRTHAYFRHEEHPLARMLAAGARVALGTDSRASAPDLSLLAELREAARRHPDVAPRALLELATLRGAEAIGAGGLSGRIAPGTRADLVAVAVSGRRPGDPHELLLDEDGPVLATWCAGVPIGAPVGRPRRQK